MLTGRLPSLDEIISVKANTYYNNMASRIDYLATVEYPEYVEI